MAVPGIYLTVGGGREFVIGDRWGGVEIHRKFCVDG